LDACPRVGRVGGSGGDTLRRHEGHVAQPAPQARHASAIAFISGITARAGSASSPQASLE
jgi:hypothetical protein